MRSAIVSARGRSPFSTAGLRYPLSGIRLRRTRRASAFEEEIRAFRNGKFLRGMPQRHYRIKHFSTPWPRKSAKKVLLTLLICFSVLGGDIFGVFFPGIFAVNHIVIAGAERIALADVTQAIQVVLHTAQRPVINTWLMLPTDKFFLVDSEALHTTLQKLSPLMKSVTVKKRLPNGLEVQLQERHYVGTWCGTADPQNTCYLIDTDGMLYGDAASSSGTLLLLIKDTKSARKGERVLEAQTLEMLRIMREDLYTRFGFVALEFLMDGFPDVTAHMDRNWELKFDGADSPENILASLAHVLSELEATAAQGPIEDRIAYIDLRVAGRAYYKLR